MTENQTEKPVNGVLTGQDTLSAQPKDESATPRDPEKEVIDGSDQAQVEVTPTPSENVTPKDATEDESQYPAAFQLTLIIFSLCIAVFLVALDQTIIAPALGAITGQFHSVKDIGWYGSSYLLTTTALQPMYGTIYKYFNVKIFYLVAIFIFELGSLVTAVAPTSVAFIIGRAIAGIGTAGLFSGSIVILSRVLPLRRRPIFFGLIGGMWGIASVAGPLLGGAFTENVTWRWCFYINLPIGGLAAVIVFFFVHVKHNSAESAGSSVLERVRQLDLIGTAIFLPAIIMLLLALQWGGAPYPWNSARIIGLFCGAGATLILFALSQLWQGDKGTLPPRLFKDRNILPAMLFVFFFGAGFFTLIYYLSLYFQAIQGDTAVQAGIKILPLLLSTVFMSIVTGGLITAIGYYSVIIIPCMILYAVGCGMIATFDTNSPERVWFGYQVLTGLGVGPGFQIGVLVVQTVMTQEWVPVGTACVQFFQALGGAVAVAVAQAIFQNGLVDQVNQDDIGIDPAIFINSGANQVKEILTRMGRLDAYDAVLEAYMKGLRNTYYLCAASAALAFVSAATLQWKSVKSKSAAKNSEPVAVAA